MEQIWRSGGEDTRLVLLGEITKWTAAAADAAGLAPGCRAPFVHHAQKEEPRCLRQSVRAIEITGHGHKPGTRGVTRDSDTFVRTAIIGRLAAGNYHKGHTPAPATIIEDDEKTSTTRH